jgi:hypothetical protein
VPGLQSARARAKRDWLARLAAAPPGDSFVTCAYTCLRLPALVCTTTSTLLTKPGLGLAFFALSLPETPLLLFPPRSSHGLCLACPLRIVLCACPLHTPNLSVSHLTRLPLPSYFLAATIETPTIGNTQAVNQLGGTVGSQPTSTLQAYHLHR